MINFTWKIFSQTGNIETYLLLKELESEVNHTSSYFKNKRKEVITDPQI